MEKTTFAIKISEDVIGNFKIFRKEHRIIDSLIKINEAAKLQIYFQLEGHDNPIQPFLEH